MKSLFIFLFLIISCPCWAEVTVRVSNIEADSLEFSHNLRGVLNGLSFTSLESGTRQLNLECRRQMLDVRLINFRLSSLKPMRLVEPVSAQEKNIESCQALIQDIFDKRQAGQNLQSLEILMPPDFIGVNEVAIEVAYQ
jgi:hypothetical protein